MTGLPRAGGIAAQAVADLAFRRRVERLHSLGPRVLGELLTEIGEQRLCRTYLEQRIRQYAGIDPEHLAALGGDRFPVATRQPRQGAKTLLQNRGLYPDL